LSEYKKHLVIDLIENNTIYSFNLLELIKMWNIALHGRTYMIEYPQELKNPYTNISFKPHNLYNIYFKALFNGFHLPVFVSMYFNSNFSMNKFIMYYNCQVKEEAVHEYANSSDMYIYYELKRISREYPHIFPFLKVSENYSESIKSKQISDYKNVLKAYCYICYSRNNELITNATHQFYKYANDIRVKYGFSKLDNYDI
jgi:hypothetical protein